MTIATSLKSGFPPITAKIGVNKLSVKLVITFPNSTPIKIPIAIAIRFPPATNSLNSFHTIPPNNFSLINFQMVLHRQIIYDILNHFVTNIILHCHNRFRMELDGCYWERCMFNCHNYTIFLRSCCHPKLIR